MNLLNVVLLAIIQGAAELLPVSSSAHVIVAEKLLGLDPTTPPMTMLLVMLHTGTMFAVIVYFWQAWKRTYFESMAAFRAQAALVVAASAATAVVGGALILAIKAIMSNAAPDFAIEDLFGNARLMAGSLATAGVVIVLASRAPRRDGAALGTGRALWIGAAQGLCLPFRGFSRSGATISTGLMLGLERITCEQFSFALAVVLTPPVIVREAWRLYKALGAPTAPAGMPGGMASVVGWSLLGMLLSFAAGMLALRWLTAWLEHGRWQWFGLYCFVAAGVVLWIG